MITSMLGALTGILEAFRINSIEPLAGGSGIMFAAVAAAVIGGTALAGGSGTIVGALLGASSSASFGTASTCSGSTPTAST